MKTLPAGTPERDCDDYDYELTAYGMELFELLEWNESNNVIAFTWSPAEQKLPSFDPADQYRSLMQHIAGLLPVCFSKYMFIPELNQKGNVHIHGWYVLKDRIKYYKLFLPRCKTYGHVLPKTEYNKQPINHDWNYYCLEEIEETSVTVDGSGYPPIVCHDNVDLWYTKEIRIHLLRRITAKHKTKKGMKRGNIAMWEKWSKGL